MSHGSFIHVTWLIHIRAWLIHIREEECVAAYQSIHVTWLIRICDMTHSYMWHASFIHNMTHIYMWCDSFIYVAWLIHTRTKERVAARVYPQRVSCIASCIIHIYIRDKTHSYTWMCTFLYITRHVNEPFHTRDTYGTYLWMRPVTLHIRELDQSRYIAT